MKNYKGRNYRMRTAITLVELLVVLCLTAMLLVIILPAVLTARDIARRTQCANNLMQLNLAILGYHESNACFPMGTVAYLFADAPGQVGHSIFVAILPQLDQISVYNAINFDRNIYTYANNTSHNIALAVLCCPSDSITGTQELYPQVYGDIPLGQFAITYSNYAACAGIWYHFSNKLDRIPRLTKQDSGVAFANSSVRLADITDGLSHTMLLGERAHDLLEGASRLNAHWWFDGYFGDTLFWTMHPINPQRVVGLSTNIPDESNPFVNSASSFHAHGANFAFADGSVRFLKDTIDSWPIEPRFGMPVGVSGDAASLYILAPGTRLGVYQSLSTRNGGEISNIAVD